MDNNNYVFWLSDPSVLYKNSQYLNIIPTIKMTRVQQLNAITRLFLYIIIIASITKSNKLFIQLSLLIIFFVVILYFLFKNDQDNKDSEFNRMGDNSYEDFSCVAKISENNDEDIKLYSGYYDSNDNLHMGTYEKSHGKIDNTKINYDNIKAYKNYECRKPTSDNPFMNPLQNDFDKYDAPEACNVDDDEIKQSMVDKFDERLYKDVSDLYERTNSQRQFYTVPNVNPPDQTAFAKWLYGNTVDTCKNNQAKCLKYEDIRYNSVQRPSII